MTVRAVLDLFDAAIKDHEKSARFHEEAAVRLRTFRKKLADDADRHLESKKSPRSNQKENRRG